MKTSFFKTSIGNTPNHVFSTYCLSFVLAYIAKP
ncbi:hypothetical protein CAEBREN_30121 [Caenorhabditis brenneri]|uniref:Uncharacterized protein n=1 Tax=Caenorhabditis brenneri TaxID=135651 RepID=G0PAG2_CAEBE|nr:hypothetical protein CAEBREN_30121 [Caenorhabditis brenneri]